LEELLVEVEKKGPCSDWMDQSEAELLKEIALLEHQNQASIKRHLEVKEKASELRE
jgi:hypothetical protein